MATAVHRVGRRSEARRFQRFDIDLPVRVVVPLQDKTKIVAARGNDLSEGGLAVFAGTELRVGDTIFIEFTPPYAGKPVRVPATVRNRRGYKYGIEFEAESDEELRLIEQFRLLLHFATGNNLF